MQGENQILKYNMTIMSRGIKMRNKRLCDCDTKT